MALMVLWIAGILLGGVHPLGVLLAAAITAVVAWLTAAVGVMASAWARNSTRALGITFVAMFVFAIASRWPWWLWISLPSYREFASWMPDMGANGYAHIVRLPDALGSFALMLTTCAAAATLLSFAAIRKLRKTWGQA
jgi:hypothetical protein